MGVRAAVPPFDDVPVRGAVKIVLPVEGCIATALAPACLDVYASPAFSPGLARAGKNHYAVVIAV